MTHVCIDIPHIEDDLLDMMESGKLLIAPATTTHLTIVRQLVHGIFTCRINPLFGRL